MKKQELLNKVKKTLAKEISGNEVDWHLMQRYAYKIFEERSKHNIPGDHLSDWLKAETELKSSVRIK